VQLNDLPSGVFEAHEAVIGASDGLANGASERAAFRNLLGLTVCAFCPAQYRDSRDRITERVQYVSVVPDPDLANVQTRPWYGTLRRELSKKTIRQLAELSAHPCNSVWVQYQTAWTRRSTALNATIGSWSRSVTEDEWNATAPGEALIAFSDTPPTRYCGAPRTYALHR
jgi:hypothetical protein